VVVALASRKYHPKQQHKVSKSFDGFNNFFFFYHKKVSSLSPAAAATGSSSRPARALFTARP
jgi:hypothetical protein